MCLIYGWWAIMINVNGWKQEWKVVPSPGNPVLMLLIHVFDNSIHWSLTYRCLDVWHGPDHKAPKGLCLTPLVSFIILGVWLRNSRWSQSMVWPTMCTITVTSTTCHMWSRHIPTSIALISLSFHSIQIVLLMF